MKRRQLLKHLKTHGCVFLREGRNHTVYYNPAKGKTSTVPRHVEIDDALAKKICDDLVIPKV
ncbi:MAG: type II toxin-antitoxin system HicA family toxin [Euryarchaeota archaeon]|nr:type II toxin-antitoxin system HicA family toxin [Euryarchaeota archaeon]